jgi:hypothetical protein
VGGSVYEVLPAADQEEFRAAFEKMISSQIEGKWNELYESFDVERNPIKKEKFAKEMNGADRLKRFIPVSMTFIPPSNDWEVEGCAEFVKSPTKGEGSISTVHARHANDGWRFGHLAIELRKDVPNGVQSCILP